MGARLKRVCVGAVALVLFCAAPAGAQSARSIVAVAGDRAALDAAKLDALVALELGDEAGHVARVLVDVRGDRVEVDVRFADDREPQTGSMTLPAAERERALALFVAELARAESAPAAEAPQTAAPPPPRPSAPQTSAVPAERAPPTAPVEWRMSALATMGARLLTVKGELLPTPRIEIGARRGDLRLGVIARYAHASAHDVLGDVSAHVVTGGAAATWTFASSRRLAVATGPRLEMGVVAARGEGTNGAAATAFTMTAAWEIEVHVRVGDVVLLGTMEGGSLVEGIELHADDRDVLHVMGPFVGAALGASM